VQSLGCTSAVRKCCNGHQSLAVRRRCRPPCRECKARPCADHERGSFVHGRLHTRQAPFRLSYLIVVRPAPRDRRYADTKSPRASQPPPWGAVGSEELRMIPYQSSRPHLTITVAVLALAILVSLSAIAVRATSAACGESKLGVSISELRQSMR